MRKFIDKLGSVLLVLVFVSVLVGVPYLMLTGSNSQQGARSIEESITVDIEEPTYKEKVIREFEELNEILEGIELEGNYGGQDEKNKN